MFFGIMTEEKPYKKKQFNLQNNLQSQKYKRTNLKNIYTRGHIGNHLKKNNK